jgi:hypothetical protein
MGRTYRRNPDDYYSYGKSLREKRQRGGTRSNWESFEAKGSKKKKKWDQESDSNMNYYSENFDD